MITLIDCLSVSVVSNSFYPLLHMSVPSEQQVSLHTDSWQHHNPKPHIQEEPSYVTFESSNHRCRPPQWGSSMNFVPCHQIFLLISSFGFWQVVCNLLPSDRWHHIDCMASPSSAHRWIFLCSWHGLHLLDRIFLATSERVNTKSSSLQVSQQPCVDIS